MDTKGCTHSKWAKMHKELQELEEGPESDDSCTDPAIAGDETPLKKNARRGRWYTKLGLNIKAIIEDMPVVIKYLDRQTKADAVKVRLWPSVIKRIVHLKEARPGLFFTMSDVIRFIMIPGLDIAEEVFKRELSELNKNKTFALSSIVNEQIQLHSHLEEVKNQVELILTKEFEGFIDEEEADREMQEILDNSPTRYVKTIYTLIASLVSEGGQKHLKFKNRRTEYMKEYRHLRVVGKDE